MSSIPLPSLLAPAAVATLLLSLLAPLATEADPATVTGAPASQQKSLVALDGAAVPTLGSAPDGTLSAAIEDAGGSRFGADSTLLTVPGLDAVPATIDAADLSLPDGYTAVGDVTLAVASVTGPAGGGFTVTGEGGATLLSSADGSATQTAVPSGSVLPVAWQFTATGRYTLTLQASVRVADQSGAETALATPATEFVFAVGGVAQATSTTLASSATSVSAGSTVTLTATVDPATAEGAVEFFDGAVLLGSAPLAAGESGAVATVETAALEGGEHVFTASFVPTWSTDHDASTSAPVLVTALPTATAATDRSAVTSATEDAGPGAEPTVLSAGNVALNLLLSASETAAAGTFDTATGGLLDKTSPTGTYADQVWHAATDTVIHLGDPEHDADTGTWSTPRTVEDAVAYTNGDDARLLLGLDQASAVGGVNRPYNGDVVSLGGHATLTAVTGATGRVTVTGAIDPNDSDPAVIWDSATLDQPRSQSTVTYGKGAKSWYQGWTFTEAGRYCITVALSVDSKTNGPVAASTTYTFYVGDLPDTPTTCAQDSSGSGDTDDPDTDEVAIFDSGHTDVRISLSDGALGLAMGRGDGNGLVLHDFADILIARTPESRTVPAVTDSEDLTAIGPVGSKYWYFPTSGGAEDWVWPGVSTELLSASDLSSSITLTLTDYAVDGVRQPEDAEVVVMGSTTSPTSATDTYFSSRLGLPQSTELSANMHAHPLWAFTKEGVYCLALTATARLADGHWSSASGVLTMVVGDRDASTVTPCERQDIGWVTTASKATPAVTQGEVFTATSGDVQLGLFASAGTLDLRAQTSSDGGVTAITRDAADVIIDSDFATRAGVWRVPGSASSALSTEHYPGLFIDASGVLPSQLATDSGITMTLGDVQGPGDLALTSTRYSTRSPILDSAAGGSTSHAFASMARLTILWWDVTEPGVYCVPLTWTAPLAAGGQGSASTTLTFVVGSHDPTSDDYVDRTGLTTCARGQQATGPDDGGGEDEDGAEVWNVENGTVNEAGATIMNSGHVDIASLLDDGALTTKIKDTTESSAAVYRDPETTVLQLLPDSATTVPSEGDYAFLGTGGDTIWQVSQTQQPGLLWPGWSTEAIDADALRTGVVWTLLDLSGAGEFALYQTGSFGQPTVLLNSRDGITDADSFTIPKDTHAHGSWAFSAEGNYCLAMQRTTTLANGTSVSDTFTLAIVVGTADVMQVDPSDCANDVDPVEVTPGDGAAESGDGEADDEASAAMQCVAGTAILSAGHIDYATRIVGGSVQSLIGDDTSGAKVYREPSSTILWLKPASKVTIPSGYGAIGAAGSTIWQSPQTQNTDLIWLGWSTESLSSGNSASDVTWTVDSVDGPGTMSVYLTGAFGGVQQVVFSGTGSYTIDRGVHTHANWAFSAEGVYRIGMTQSVALPGGQVSSDTETLTIVVGDVDPASAIGSGSGCGVVSSALLMADDVNAALQASAQAAAEASGASSGARPGARSDADSGLVQQLVALANGNPVALLLGVLGGLLLVGAAGAGILWWRGLPGDGTGTHRPRRP